MRDWKDRLGIVASAACAVHCAATPILIASLPTLKFTEWMASPAFHQIAAIFCSLLVAIAIVPSIIRHRDYRVLWLSSSGLALIIVAAFCLPDTCCSLEHAGHEHSEHAHHSHEPTGAGLHHHEHEHEHEHVDASTEMSLAGIGSIQPWMTPLGGVLLIVAHALNLRRRRVPCSENCKCSGTVPALVTYEPNRELPVLAKAS